MEATDFAIRNLEERIMNLELENHLYDPRFFTSQGNTEGGSFRGGLRRSSHRRTRSPNDVCLVFLIFPAKQKEVFIRKSCTTFHV